MAEARAAPAAPSLPVAPRRGAWSAFARHLLRDPYALAGISIYVVFLVVGLTAEWLAPYDPMEILFTPEGGLAASLPPGSDHWLGTTNLGRDIFSQLVMGTRPSLIVGLSAAVAVASIGTVVGLLAGYFGGWADQLLMRLTDIVLGLPFLPFVIVVTALLGPDLHNIVLAVAIMLWPNAARVIRSQVLTLSQRQFVEAARVTGAGEWRILFVHVAPSVLPFSALYGAFAVGWAILTQASIAFLGFGDSSAISWGTMLQDAYASQALDRGQFFWFMPAGLCIVLVVLAGFLVSRGYEDLLFPKLRDDK
ncbi:ABC transporter permease [Roseomonas sp. E05]|uniref:ABC transporter permease n=1 Tax=Roseomonas sp. E05 TaxID=3046310 RepID=UPI0024BB16E7|nr:ABC transporter permease [Roseomonas sp. E05]MDJ0388789.1 ABC transporter permease [Roseomonas sp. E05]